MKASGPFTIYGKASLPTPKFLFVMIVQLESDSSRNQLTGLHAFSDGGFNSRVPSFSASDKYERTLSLPETSSIFDDIVFAKLFRSACFPKLGNIVPRDGTGYERPIDQH